MLATFLVYIAFSLSRLVFQRYSVQVHQTENRSYKSGGIYEKASPAHLNRISRACRVMASRDADEFGFCAPCLTSKPPQRHGLADVLRVIRFQLFRKDPFPLLVVFALVNRFFYVTVHQTEADSTRAEEFRRRHLQHI